MPIAASPLPTRAPGRSAWPAALLVGLMLVLLVLIGSWLLRACTPVDAALNVSTLETQGAPALPPAPDPTGALKASLGDTEANGKTLRIELAALQDDLKKKVEQCKPAAPPPPLAADRWDKKDLSLLKGCWQLGRDAAVSHHFASGSMRRATAKAGRICFGEDGTGSHEQTIVDPGGTWHCKSPITANFTGNGTLTTNQPTGVCEGSPPAYWAAMQLACRRVNDTTALCQGSDKDGHVDLEFRRAP
jgi:hypothetical protein